MGSRDRRYNWNVSDGVRIIRSTPQALMAEINTAISNIEYARATSHLGSPVSSATSNNRFDASSAAIHDALMADDVYKAGCTALAAGKLDEALNCLDVCLSKCSPDKASSVTKVNSLISITPK